MNFVGPFAESENNARAFGTQLLFASSCSETVKVIKDMHAQNEQFVATGDKANLDLNKMDEGLFLEMMFSGIIIKDA